ncbi:MULTISPECIES: mannitol dehydrogenase family protein [Fusobacterium]|uniref:mannitol dehydrogenase family protein n=1 Tax=Fusobacterium TaxID=848 RepID=UPI001476A619|nr:MULTISPECIES: mannitol dehydrogenase family protein [Fusobacterium]NME35531.1 mannitol dehydrogenase family protein [Fusobacterium sp. FSA-380-WT-3A]
MKLSLNELETMASNNIKIPLYDIKKIRENTLKTPKWLHFGGGNIFRAYVAKMQENLLNNGKENTGIIVAESFDEEIIDKVYRPFDNLSVSVVLSKDGKFLPEIIGSVIESLKVKENRDDLVKIVTSPSLQIISFTITEKGYNLKDPNGEFFDIVKEDIQNLPEKSKHIMSIITYLLYKRFKNNREPIALVSMDNCSGNGDKIREAVLNIATFWVNNGYLEKEFLDYLTDEKKVSYPISMIDKITPRPAQVVKEYLEKLGFENMDIIVTNKNTYTSAFVNSETAEYFVVEDKFPNGRPLLEEAEAGVYITNREIVEKTERMKVTTCLNPLHTTLAIFGCLLNKKTIYEAVSDPLLNKLIKKIGYDEALKVVDDPKILDPKKFIDEVINERFANPFIPDQPERIATDTSQKVGIRFGETLKAYLANDELKIENIKYIPLVYAGWFRYLMGIDDEGNERSISSDPMLEMLKEKMRGIEYGNITSYQGQLKEILKNKIIFGVDLEKIGIADKVEKYFVEMLNGKNAVINTLKKYI